MSDESEHVSRRVEAQKAGLTLEGLYDQFAGEIYAFLLSSVGNQGDAEDALQQCFISLNRQLAKGLPENPRAYLYGIARNRTKDHFRSNLARKDREQRWLELVPDSVEPIDLMANDEYVLEIEQALMSLPDEQRQVVALKIWQNKTFAEIGEILEMSPNTAASRYRYALQALRLELNKEEFAS